MLIYRFVENFKISTSEEWSSLGEEANGGGGASEAPNNLHLLAASAGLNEDDCGDSDSVNGTPKKRRRRSSTDTSKMQTTDVVRVPGLSQDLQQQITKFDSSEFDVSFLQDLYHFSPCNDFREHQNLQLLSCLRTNVASGVFLPYLRTQPKLNRF